MPNSNSFKGNVTRSALNMCVLQCSLMPWHIISLPLGTAKRLKKEEENKKNLNKLEQTLCDHLHTCTTKVYECASHVPINIPLYVCAVTTATSGVTSGPSAQTTPMGVSPARPPTISEDHAALPYTHISTAILSWFIVLGNILWSVSVADCLFVTDCSLFVDNPLLSPFVRESSRTYWLH
jgi:hypothetical protein